MENCLILGMEQRKYMVVLEHFSEPKIKEVLKEEGTLGGAKMAP